MDALGRASALLAMAALCAFADEAPQRAPDFAEPAGCFVGATGPPVPGARGARPCAAACADLYYGYAAVDGDECLCANSPGTRAADEALCAGPCAGAPPEACARDVYRTGVVVPGPPVALEVSDATETGVSVRWSEPEARSVVSGYGVRAEVVSTPAEDVPEPLEWTFSNGTLGTRLTDLHPGTVYDVTVRALSPRGEGVAARARAETAIGEPDPPPPPPVVVERRATRIVVRLTPATNRNGPVTRYRLVVADESLQRGFQPERLLPHGRAVEEGLPYYVAAELRPDEIERDFVVGDGRQYGGFYNAPLVDARDVRVSVGVVSEQPGTGATRARYASAADHVVLNIDGDEAVSGPVMALGVAVAIATVLLFVGVGAAIVLRRRAASLGARRRLAQAMPLTGSAAEAENGGFVSEDGREELEGRLWSIPRNFLEVDEGAVAAVGRYGDFVRGRVRHRGAPRATLVQIVPDRALSKADRRTMIGELDALVAADGHDNAIALIGVCELPDALCVVLEECRGDLKSRLLASRRDGPGCTRTTTESEAGALRFALGVSEGMAHLASRGVLHERLCCRNVALGDGATPKVTGFGLSRSRPPAAEPDHSRWRAAEVFALKSYASKSDVWSFGALLWELLTLGGTPYPLVSDADLPGEVLRGTRPARPGHVGDELYELCLRCWQSDPDERPAFRRLADALRGLADRNPSELLSFDRRDGFEHHPYLPEAELKRLT